MIEDVKEDYMDGMKYKDIVEKYDIKMNTLKSWISRNSWAKERNEIRKRENSVNFEESRDMALKSETCSYDEMVKVNSNLTDKQHLFCIYYLKYFNATKAYQKAYDCSYNSAMVGGCRNLKNKNIRDEIEKMKALRLQDVYLDSKDIMQKYIDIAFSDITDFVSFGYREKEVVDDKFGCENYFDLKNSSQIDGSLISEVSCSKNGTKFKLLDKMKALDWLSNNLPKMSDKNLDREILKLKIEKEKISIDKMRNEIKDTKVEPISIEIISKDKR